VDSAGNLYIADNNHRIGKLSNGVTTFVAGNGMYGYGGDNGPATGAELSNPAGVAVDSTGKLYIADMGNSRIRVLIPSFSIGAVANAASNLAGPVSPARSWFSTVPASAPLKS
jgi:DNA-binding beta-propeller fold protein YncE